MKTCLVGLFALFTTLSVTLSAQSLSGRVIDNNQHPVENAYVYSVGLDQHVHTKKDGSFAINQAQVNDTLRISHLGYKTQSVPVISLDAPLTITLQEQSFDISEVVIAQKLDALNAVADFNLATNPVTNSQEVLRLVPGLFIGQHAGGGKAEQIFLRGFDLDHGTDIQLTADGMPINMVSHAHGQGYADMHFIIPESIEKIDFGKGAYYGDKGNFATAGYVDVQTKDRLEQSLVKTEVGQFGHKRLLSMVDVFNKNGQSAYIATEFYGYDGPFESPQNLSRTNIFAKYSGLLNSSNRLEASFSTFTSQWNASGQIPQRAVDNGSISRFGAIDDTEGGNTARTNINLEHHKRINANTSIVNQAYYSYYDFTLFSNFTFFLEDSVNGDQIKQQERRNIFGVSSTLTQNFSGSKVNGTWRAGVNLRSDNSYDNELSETLNRSTTLNILQKGNIYETNYGAFADAQFHWGKWTLNPAVRVDYFNFEYQDALTKTYTFESVEKAIVSPKINLFYAANPNVQWYLKAGKGFHSNDTRVVVAQNGRTVLPASYGSDLGILWKPTSKLLLNAAVWQLYLEQEFVYVGDAGIVEPSGETQRQGIELSARYAFTSWLTANADVTLTDAFALNTPEEENNIPLAPNVTATGGLAVQHPSGWFGNVRFRHLADRPANEDNSIVALGYTVFDANIGYKRKSWAVQVFVQNLFDTNWNEAQFATESQLRNETEPVEELHFTPGTPLAANLAVSYTF